MKKHNIIILSIMLAIIVVVSASVGIYAWWYGNVEHTEQLSDSTMLEYNVRMTAYARGKGQLASGEVLVIHSMTKELGSDMVVKFYIYQLAEGEKDADLLRLSTEEIESDGKHVRMGQGSATLVGDSIANIRDLTVLYIR